MKSGWWCSSLSEVSIVMSRVWPASRHRCVLSFLAAVLGLMSSFPRRAPSFLQHAAAFLRTAASCLELMTSQPRHAAQRGYIARQCMHCCQTQGAVSVQIPAVKGSKVNPRGQQQVNSPAAKGKRYGSIEMLTSTQDEWKFIVTHMLKGINNNTQE